MIYWRFFSPDSAFLNAFESAIVAPLVEEPLKLLPLVFVLALIPVRKLKSLFLLGIASGLGFQMIEDIGYIRTDLPEGFDFTISRILERIISGIASHWTFFRFGGSRCLLALQSL